MLAYHEGMCIRLKTGVELFNFSHAILYRPFISSKGVIVIEDDFGRLNPFYDIRHCFDEEKNVFLLNQINKNTIKQQPNSVMLSVPSGECSVFKSFVNSEEIKEMKESFYDFDDLKPFQRVHVYSPHVNDIHYGIVAQNANDKFIIYPNEPHYSCDGSGVSYDSRTEFKPNNSYKIVAVYEAPTFIVEALDPLKYGELVWKDDTEERKQKLKELQERETKVLEELASIKAELRELED